MGYEIFGIDIEEPLPYIGVSLLNLILFLVVLVIGIVIAIAVSRGIKRSLLKSKAGELLAEFASRIIKIMLYIFVFAIALGFLGIDISAALISLSVVLGFVLGFALGDTLSNVASGFMIAITKPFKSEDYVDIGGKSGTVKSVGISLTELDTPDNKRIIIPNKSVWGSPIINYTRHGIRRVDMTMGVGYDDNLDKVIKTTKKVLGAHSKVLSEPEPQVEINELADSSVNLVVRPWTKTEDYWDVFFDIKKALKEEYDNVGISIPYPQMDVHMEK